MSARAYNPGNLAGNLISHVEPAMLIPAADEVLAPLLLHNLSHAYMRPGHPELVSRDAYRQLYTLSARAHPWRQVISASNLRYPCRSGHRQWSKRVAIQVHDILWQTKAIVEVRKSIRSI